ncbi:MAG: hypothetical protein M1830_005841 [Pleopsidium flavum]|nr:MAG: hypothetical protein M1830_005841 [Pleopsidium flavum]
MLPPLTSTPLIPPAVPATLPFPLAPPPIAATPTVLPAALPRPALVEISNDVEITSASLKLSRPHLISTLYEAQSNQCTSCGRRFVATEEGKRKKAKHLDWHFRVNQRMADAAKRGQNRSWYVDEMEWIKSRESEEDIVNTNGNGVSAPTIVTSAPKDPKSKWIRVPDDPALANSHCPICQEKFETQWNTDAQDFVWMDAVKIGARVYHASCHAEASKDGGGTPMRAITPDPVLGKRKADNDLNALRARIKREPIAS